MENILIIDKGCGNLIDFVVNGLREIYGETVKISCSHPWHKIDLQDGPDGPIDLFFISGKAILDGEIDPKECKNVYGKPTSKVVAISTDSTYLREIEKGDYGVDYFQDKDYLSRLGFNHDLKILSDLEFEKAKNLLKSYLS